MSATRVMKETQADAVKIEGGRAMADTIRKLTSVGIPVLSHVGLMPQRQASIGGFKVQGKTALQAEKVLQDALAVQDSGCIGVVVEAIPAVFADLITSKLEIPTIGIGGGAGCSGQILVQADMLGVFDRFSPR